MRGNFRLGRLGSFLLRVLCLCVVGGLVFRWLVSKLAGTNNQYDFDERLQICSDDFNSRSWWYQYSLFGALSFLFNLFGKKANEQLKLESMRHTHSSGQNDAK